MLQGKKKRKERMLMPGCTFVNVPAVVVGVVSVDAEGWRLAAAEGGSGAANAVGETGKRSVALRSSKVF